MMIDLNEIIPGRLWVGGYVREEGIAELRSLGITTVISLQTDEDLKRHGISPGDLEKAYQKAGIEWRRVPTPDFDSEALARSLPNAVTQVQEALADPRTRVYLHCTVGINRSATTAAGFLILSRGISVQEACRYLAARRECSPTLDVLHRYEETLRGTRVI